MQTAGADVFVVVVVSTLVEAVVVASFADIVVGDGVMLSVLSVVVVVLLLLFVS